MSYLTYQDCIEHTFRYLGGGAGDQVLSDLREAVTFAYREVYSAHTWSYYYKQGRIATIAPYTNNTISYSFATNTVTMDTIGGVTADGTTFPPWAADGYVRLGTATHRVLARTSPTTLLMDPMVHPITDVPPGTGFILYKDSYLLPPDFQAGDAGTYENCFGPLSFTHPREWMMSQRYIYQAGVPQAFTISGEDRYPGLLLLRLFPVPTDSRTLDYIYKRAPRQLYYPQVTTGNVSLAGNVLTSSAGVFTPIMQGPNPYTGGSVVRISNTQSAPTSPAGANPAAFEAKILTVTNQTTAILDATSPIAYPNSAYIISDPLDIEPQSMTTVMYRACEMMIGMSRITKDKPDAAVQYQEALRRAKERDSRSFARRWAGDALAIHRQHLKDMPMGPDKS